jgi:hypothetical protein
MRQATVKRQTGTSSGTVLPERADHPFLSEHH